MRCKQRPDLGGGSLGKALDAEDAVMNWVFVTGCAKVMHRFSLPLTH